MFRSKSTYQEYLNSLLDVGAPADLNVNDIEDHILHDNEAIDDYLGGKNEENVDTSGDIENIIIPEGFNDDEEVLIIDGIGNAKIHKGRINMKFVYGLDTPNKILVPMNKYYQPIKKAGAIFNRFLADVAKRHNLCPLNYKEWRLVPNLFKDRIMMYIRTKFVLPLRDRVRSKVLSSVGDRLRGYKRYLRLTYIKENTTKEELYQLPVCNANNSDMLTRPKGVPDTVWYGFVDLCFSENFKKSSEIGKKSRGHVLHPHRSGSQSSAIRRDKFEKNEREPEIAESPLRRSLRPKKRISAFVAQIPKPKVAPKMEIVNQNVAEEEEDAAISLSQLKRQKTKGFNSPMSPENIEANEEPPMLPVTTREPLMEESIDNTPLNAKITPKHTNENLSIISPREREDVEDPDDSVKTYAELSARIKNASKALSHSPSPGISQLESKKGRLLDTLELLVNDPENFDSFTTLMGQAQNFIELAPASYHSTLNHLRKSIETFQELSYNKLENKGPLLSSKKKELTDSMEQMRVEAEEKYERVRTARETRASTAKKIEILESQLRQAKQQWVVVEEQYADAVEGLASLSHSITALEKESEEFARAELMKTSWEEDMKVSKSAIVATIAQLRALS